MSDLKQIITMDLFVTIPEDGDVRVKDWPLMESIFPTFMFVIIYLLFVVFGQKWMENRRAFDLRKFMFVYNIFQVIFYTYITYEATFIWIKEGYSLLCQPIDFSQSTVAMRVCQACWCFYIMKLIDLFVTIIFVLRKKAKQITFLHVYYHITMIFCAWIIVQYAAGGQSLFVVIINSFIHIIMYGYYTLSIRSSQTRKYLWWKRYLTQAQIVQFLSIITHSSINLQRPCNFPKIADIIFLTYGITILLLLANLYLRSYIGETENDIENNYTHHKKKNKFLGE